MKLNREFWAKKYQKNATGWDAGGITTPLKEYIDQLTDKNCKILIPGAGNGYEAEYLHKKGFTQVYVLDIVKQPLDHIKNRVPTFSVSNLLLGNFFDVEDTFDLVIEQTFFCALNPKLRDQYVDKMYDILNPNGKIAGVLFQFPLTKQGPPFGGSKQEYIERFSSKFKIKTLKTAYNSIKPREQNELFIIFEKK